MQVWPDGPREKCGSFGRNKAHGVGHLRGVPYFFHNKKYSEVRDSNGSRGSVAEGTKAFWLSCWHPWGRTVKALLFYCSSLVSVGKKKETMRHFNSALIAVALLLSGCMTTKKMNAIMGSWTGCNVNDLIADWGPPSGTMSDGNGGQILIFDRSGQFVVPGTATTTANYMGNATATYSQYGNTGVANANSYGTGYSTTTYQPPRVIPVNRKRMFWVNRKGTIYRWSWQGL